MISSTLPADRPSDTPTAPAPSRTRIAGIAWHLAVLALAKPATGDSERFLRGLLAVALEGEVQQ